MRRWRTLTSLVLLGAAVGGAWWQGREVEMPWVTVRYDFAPNPCPFSIELRRNRQGQWRVFNFQSTVG